MEAYSDPRREEVVRLYEQGRRQEAAELADILLHTNPEQPDLHYLLGLIHHQEGRSASAIPHLCIANKSSDATWVYAWALAEAARATGDIAMAESAYHDALKRNNTSFDVNLNLATLLHHQGRAADALACFMRCVELDPKNPLAHCNVGAAWQALNQFEQSESSYKKSLELSDQLPQTWNNYGNLLHTLNRKDEARRCFEQALKINPTYTEAIANLGDLMQTSGEIDAAIALYARARATGCHSPELVYNEGNAYLRKDEFDRAIACYQDAIKLNPQMHQPYSNLGVAYLALGDIKRAMASYQKAIHLKPDFVDAHWNRSLAWLITGNYEQGWPEHEWRWRLKKYMRRNFSQPLWDGEERPGQRLLLMAEQGLGDALHFIRYAPLARERVGRIILECPPPLVNLMRSCPGVDEVVPQGTALPEFDVQVPLFCLPRIFKTKLETIPNQIPYLKLPEKSSSFSYNFPEGFRVAICWAGSPTHDNDRNRSCPLELFLPLMQIPDVKLLSFQKGPATEQLKKLPVDHLIPDVGSTFNDFVDTAQALQAIDLLISVDTSVVHLAGGLGKPVWVLLPFNPDWRWMLNRPDSPWYPTARLFRQAKHGDWPGVMSAVSKALAELPRQSNRPDARKDW